MDIDTLRKTELPDKATWDECVSAFRTMDAIMGTAFHLKVSAIRIARRRFYEQNGKCAGFVKKFAADAVVSYSYASKLNRIEKTFSHCNVNNFSSDAADLLLSFPEEDREEFLEQHGDNPVTATDVKTFTEKLKPVTTTYEKDDDEDDTNVIEAFPTPVVPPRRTSVDGVIGSIMFAGNCLLDNNLKGREEEVVDEITRMLLLEDPLGELHGELLKLFTVLEPIREYVTNNQNVKKRKLQ